ncbi:MAG: cupin domain-containing protein [Pseudomonadota bacterium]
MHLVPHLQAPAYDAPGHFGFSMKRLQGRNAGPADTAWIGLSLVEPGGHTTLAASPQEKFYVVVEGVIEITGVSPEGDSTIATLGPLDSCRIAPGEGRLIFNRSGQPARVLLVMAEAREPGPL